MNQIEKRSLNRHIKEKRRMVMIPVWVREETKKKIQDICAKEGKAVSPVMRDLMETWVDHA